MKRAASLLFVSLLTAASFVAGGHFSQRSLSLSTSASASTRHILYYACPMHPSLRSERPGDCTACGMRRDPVYNQPVVQTAAANNHDRALPPGSVRVSPDRQQIIGVKVAAVQRASSASVLRTTGRVAVDEARTYHLISGMQGRVVQVFPGATGDIVKKGQLLAVTSYLPDFLIAQQTYVSALNALDSYKEADARAAAEAKAAEAVAAAEAKVAAAASTTTQTGSTTPSGPTASAPDFNRRPGGAPMAIAAGRTRVPAPPRQMGFADFIRSGSQVRTTRETLLTLGMGVAQADELARTRKIVDTIEIRAPADSVILERGIYPQQKFDKGVEFYRLADLSHVWILADVSGDDGKYLRPGKSLQVTRPNQAGWFRAKVSAALPQFDEASRMLRVRLEADNPRYLLKPGMFLDVRAPMRTAPSLVAPVDAVLDSGLSKTVFVDRGQGIFEPRRVETGWRSVDKIQITKGLYRGERIVVSGNFLLDSESRMKQTAADMKTEPHRRPLKRL